MHRTQQYWENRPEVYQITFGEFAREYAELLPIMRDKEGRIGHLDLHAPNYVPMTAAEIALHQKDWKAFSRARGFSAYDIAEYARWHKLTGQTDGLEYAINDPWRRPVAGWDATLYLKHIERAKAMEIQLSPQVEQSYLRTRKKEETAGAFFHAAKKKIKMKNDGLVQATLRNENDDWD